MAFMGYLLAGLVGVIMLIISGLIIVWSAPRISTRFIMHIYGAQAVNRQQLPEIYKLLQLLADRAHLQNIPQLYYLPSHAMLAFSVGIKGDEAVILSDAMLRRLNLRELTAVLAHEISHIYNKDISVMMLADLISRFTAILAMTGYILIMIYLPFYIFTDHKIPWLFLAILMLAPNVSAILQLALSRTREFNADFNAVLLTGDPQGLASALSKIEHFQGHWFETVLLPNRKLPDPSLLRTHPKTSDRIDRLLALNGTGYNDSDSHDVDLDLSAFKPYHHHKKRRFNGFWY